MLKLLKYLKGYVKQVILGPLFKLCEAALELMVPIVVTEIIDIGISNNNINYIYKMGIVLVLLAVTGLTTAITAQYFSAKAAVGFGTRLREEMFKHIMNMSYSQVDSIGSSTLITRITADINTVQACINMLLRLFMRSPFIVFGSMIMAFTIDKKVGLIFLVSIPILFAVVFAVTLVSIPIYEKAQTRLDKITSLTGENIAGVRVIRAFNRQETELKDFNNSCDSLKKTQLFVGKISALMNPVTYVIINAAIILVIWVGGKQVYSGNLTQGNVVALYNYMAAILVELIKLSNLIIQTTKAFACAKRIEAVLEDKSEIDDSGIKTPESKNDIAVKFDNVTFIYKNAGEPSLENISFEAKKGQTIGIIGSTGSGKTTLVNLIPRFYDVQSGNIFVDGENVKNIKLSFLRNKIGIVPQKPVLFSGTIRDNMLWGKQDATDSEILKAIKISQADDIIAKKDGGLDAGINENGKNFSGGQKQRLTIARALTKSPEILILDDSASALDFATDKALRKSIKSQTEGMTVFIVTQRATTIKDADLIIVLDDGKIAGIGNHKHLLNECEVYREICFSQLSEKEVMENV